MINELRELKQLRTEVVELTKLQDELRAKIEETPQYKTYLDNHTKLELVKQSVAELEDAIRIEAVELSRETGFEQKKFGLVSVKEFTKIVINDMETAILWASRNVPNCLSLTKDFDKVAKAIPLPFVTIEKEYKGAIASNLSELEDENE